MEKKTGNRFIVDAFLHYWTSKIHGGRLFLTTPLTGAVLPPYDIMEGIRV